jgi:hypothetical protein
MKQYFDFEVENIIKGKVLIKFDIFSVDFIFQSIDNLLINRFNDN